LPAQFRNSFGHRFRTIFSMPPINPERAPVCR
jgi:hypothetical protein